MSVFAYAPARDLTTLDPGCPVSGRPVRLPLPGLFLGKCGSFSFCGGGRSARAKNLEAERRAANVRLIAERRYGELLATLARAEAPNPNGAGGHTHKVVTSTPETQQERSPYAQALADTGFTRQQAHRYQALANVPKPTFDEALADMEGAEHRADVGLFRVMSTSPPTNPP